MEIGEKKSTLFEYESQKKRIRGKFLTFKDVKCRKIVIASHTHTCIDCREKLYQEKEAYHIKKYNTELFSAFMCVPCFEIFKNNEVEI